jgi:hypothetical protein
MFAKLLATIVGLGLTAGVLLVNRQHRIDVAVEISRSGDRLRDQESSLALMQAEIAASVHPDRLNAMIAALEAPETSSETEESPWIAIPTRFDPIPIAPLVEPDRAAP